MTTAEWLEEASKQAGLSAEEQAALNGVFSKNQKLAKYVEESGLRQSDYDRNMNKLKAEHQTRIDEIAQKEAATDAFARQNGEWFAKNNGAHQKALKDLEDARVKEAQLVERMKGVATRYGVPIEELDIPVSTTPVTPAAAAPAFDDKKYVSREEAIKEMSAMPLVQAEMLELTEEHRELFGKPLRNAKALVQQAMKQNKSIRQVWEEENKVADRRETIKEQSVQARIDSAVSERENKIRSEMNLPAPRPAEQHSPIVDRFAKPVAQPKTDPGRGLRAALAAFGEGKYRGAA